MVEHKAREQLKILEESHREFEILRGIRRTIHQRLKELHGDELSELAIQIDILLGNLGELEVELDILYHEVSDQRKMLFNHWKVFTEGNEDRRIQGAYEKTKELQEAEYIQKFLWKTVQNRRDHFSSLSTKLQTRINVLRDERIRSNQ